MVTSAKTDREFCSACGWPLGGMRCEACGAERMQLLLRDATAAEVPREVDGGDAGDKAAEAFRNKEWTRFVGYVVTAEGGASARTVATDDGPGWVATVGGAVLFVTLALVGQDVRIEAPVVHLPREQRVAVMRGALEGFGGAGCLAHACLRDDLLLLRVRIRLASVTPAILKRTLRDTARAARSAIEMLGASFRARPIVPAAERAHAGFEVLGTVRKLAKVIADDTPIAALANAEPPLAPGARQAPEPVLGRRGTPVGVRVPTPALGAAPPPPLEPGAGAREPVQAHPPKHAPEPEDDDELPAILAVPLTNRKSSPPVAPLTPRKSMPPPLPPRAARQPPAPEQALASGGAAARAPDAELAKPLDDRKATFKEGAPPRLNGGRLATLEIEAVGADLEPGARRAAPSGEVAILPMDRFGALLKRAQLLAGGALAEGPGGVTWIARAAVYRAVYEFREPLPDAVAYLYRATGVGNRGDTPAPEADEVLAVLERLVDPKATVPKEKPLVVQPLTSAQQAKDHVSRYIAEIERSGSDPGLRHYLALGALCELLVRAKLPTQTSQRLRDIISHAQREGAKPSAIELLMTALKRISA